MIKIVGFNLEFRKSFIPRFIFINWHLGFATQFETANCSIFLCIGWIIINIWGEDKSLWKRLGV